MNTHTTTPPPFAGATGVSLPGQGWPGVLVEAGQHRGASRAPVTGGPDVLDVRADLRELAGREYRLAGWYEDIARGRPLACVSHQIAGRHFSNCRVILRMLLEEEAA